MRFRSHWSGHRAWRQEDAEIAILRERFESLTPREREVLPWVVSGLLSKQIADDIGTSETIRQGPSQPTDAKNGCGLRT